MITTFGFEDAINNFSSVNLGVNDKDHDGDVLLFSPFSSFTQDFRRCSSSSWKLVSSQRSLRADVFFHEMQLAINNNLEEFLLSH
uniref:Uncharacterized protein n=1 Tax=Arundo donax TaxID=35708 RepID=A0A0A9DXB6_ARUDO